MINPLARACKNLSDHPRTVDTSVLAIANVPIKWPASIRNVAIRASVPAELMPFAMLSATHRCARVYPVTLAIRLRNVLLNNVRTRMNYIFISVPYLNISKKLLGLL